MDSREINTSVRTISGFFSFPQKNCITINSITLDQLILDNPIFLKVIKFIIYIRKDIVTFLRFSTYIHLISSRFLLFLKLITFFHSAILVSIISTFHSYHIPMIPQPIHVLQTSHSVLVNFQENKVKGGHRDHEIRWEEKGERGGEGGGGGERVASIGNIVQNGKL